MKTKQAPQPIPETLLSSKQLAARWGMHPQSLVNLRHEKKGPKYIKMGKKKGSKIRYRMADVLEYEIKMLRQTKD